MPRVQRSNLADSVLDLKSEFKRRRVVITDYGGMKNCQHSFPVHEENTKPLFSFCHQRNKGPGIGDPPSAQLSHAMKTIEADLHVACTGTPVETACLICGTSAIFSSAGCWVGEKFVERFESPQQEVDQERRLVELKRRLLFQQQHAFCSSY